MGLWVTYRRDAAEGAEQIAQLAADHPPGLEIERGQRLVQQQQPGIEHQRAGQRGALLLSAGERVRPTRAELRNPRPPERFGHARRDLTARRPRRLEPEADVLPNREMGEERVVLRHVPDVALPGGNRDARLGVRVDLAVEHDSSGIRLIQAGGETKDRGLAGAALAHQHGRRRVRRLERDVELERRRGGYEAGRRARRSGRAA